MPFADQITLLNETENALIQRRNSTTDPEEKAVLTEEIQEVRDLRDMTSFDSLFETAAALNDLAGVIENAAAALRKQPFDSIFGAYQSLLDRIAETTGTIIKLVKPASAEEEEDETPAEAAVALEGAPDAPDDDVRKTLAKMYADCDLRSDKVAAIDRFYVKPIVKNRATYDQVGARLGVPWWFIGVIHGLESAFNLSTHLHNGDPLTARTVQVPKGRPELGAPPFTWLESAIDAMRLKKFDDLDDWSIGVTLDRLERYNGLGYRKRGLPSPYLWGFSEHYKKGKFVADGVFDPEAVSKQCGGAALIRRLDDLGLIDTKKPLDADAGGMAAVNVVVTPSAAGVAPPVVAPGELDLPAFVKKWAKAELDFPGEIAKGAKDSDQQRTVHRVQEWCSFHTSQTGIDGDYGAGTEAAVKGFQRKAGLPETGVVGERTWAAMTAPMRTALAPVAVAPGDTIYDVVLKVARVHLDIHPIEFTVKGQGNCGPWVRLYMHGEEGSDQPWCAGFVSHVIGQAAHGVGQPVPIKRRVSVDLLVEDAKGAGRFLEGSKLTTAARRIDKIRKGSLFVVRKSSTDWTHVGFVTEVGDDFFLTIEGNTNDEGSREGFEVCARSRGFKNRDFVLLI